MYICIESTTKKFWSECFSVYFAEACIKVLRFCTVE